MTKQLSNKILISNLLTVSVFSSAIGQGVDQIKKSYPNILCITCEDISAYLACYGDSTAPTPNIDRLANQGVLFRNCFDVSGVSAPSRFCLITGMYPSSCGAGNMRTSQKDLPDNIPSYEAVTPPEVRCYSEFLRSTGYYCTNNEKTDYQFKTPITAWDDCSNTAHWRNRPKGMPFFSIFNIMTSHESQIWDRANDPMVVAPEKVKLPPYYPDDPIVRKDIARMYTNITIMDREVGEILNQLEKDGLLDSTIIIFYSDNGGPMPRQKREIYDSGTHVPFMIRFPNKQFAGTVVNDLISFVDIPPTILSLAGEPIPSYIQGQAFWGNQKSTPRKYIYAARDRMDECYDHVRVVRDEQFLYVRNFRTDLPNIQDITFRKNMAMMQRMLELEKKGKLNSVQKIWFKKNKPVDELYDVVKDPHQIHNLAKDRKYKNELELFKNELDTWLIKINDKGNMTEKELVWSMWPNGIQPETAKPEIDYQNGKATMKCKTEGASIAYQLNGKGYNEKHWFLYFKPIDIPKGTIISVTAIRIGFKQSLVETFVVQ